MGGVSLIPTFPTVALWGGVSLTPAPSRSLPKMEERQSDPLLHPTSTPVAFQKCVFQRKGEVLVFCDF